MIALDTDVLAVYHVFHATAVTKQQKGFLTASTTSRRPSPSSPCWSSAASLPAQTGQRTRKRCSMRSSPLKTFPYSFLSSAHPMRGNSGPRSHPSVLAEFKGACASATPQFSGRWKQTRVPASSSPGIRNIFKRKPRLKF